MKVIIAKQNRIYDFLMAQIIKKHQQVSLHLKTQHLRMFKNHIPNLFLILLSSRKFNDEHSEKK